MNYDYRCPEHGVFEIWKSMNDAARQEYCPQCGTEGVRLWNNNGGFMGEKVEHSHWHPSLGCVVKSNRHAKEIAASRGLVEVGSEKPDTVHREMESLKEAKREQSYNEVLKSL
jgi:putative FmdB family regulatory protein